jgi:hypothetical protein
VLPPQSSESKSQERSAQTSKLRHKTFGPASDSMALGSLPGSMESTPRHQAPYQAPWHQDPRHHVPRCQAPQHQLPQQRFVPANHSGKTKFNKSKHSKRPQKVEDDLYSKEPPIWMQSMMLWMDQQMKSCQRPPIGRQAWVKKKEDIHPIRGNGLT